MSRGGPSYRRQWAQLRLRRWLAVSSAAWLLGCDADPSAPAPDAGGDAVSEHAGPEFCQREVESGDAVREVFCADAPPEITDFRELKRLLTNAAIKRELNLSIAFPLLLGHSTSLTGHHVSSINPRAILILAPGGGPVIAFTRGVQQVEISVMSRDQNTRRFYLLKFEQACNALAEGCKHADLYTPQIEQDWLHVEISDDEALKNTPADCRQCHQRARSNGILLMREFLPPWTHFFEPLAQEDGLRSLPGVLNTALTRDYVAAHGDEPYAGVELERLSPAGGSLLQAAAGADQPVIFSSQEILNERWPREPDGRYPEQPVPSALWENAYAAFKRGEQLALPYVEQRATDPSKLEATIAAYAAYRAGELDAAELPDLADVFPDDPMLRARIGLQTEPDAEPVDLLIQACGACHNDVLDQSITRARFNIDVSRMAGKELDRAIDRLRRKPGEAGVMPPPEARQLDAAGKERLVEYLRTAARSGATVDALQHAAQVGMTGGATISSGSTAQ
jgi:hypothetical protein